MLPSDKAEFVTRLTKIDYEQTSLTGTVVAYVVRSIVKIFLIIISRCGLPSNFFKCNCQARHNESFHNFKEPLLQKVEPIFIRRLAIFVALNFCNVRSGLFFVKFALQSISSGHQL